MGIFLVELGKVFKMGLVRTVFILAFAFSLLSLVAGIDKGGSVSAFTIPISAISNLTQTLIIVIFAGFTGYIYGVEVQAKTLKIIRSKNIADWKVLSYKFLVALVTVALLILSIGIFIFLIAATLFPLTDFMVRYDNGIITAANGLHTLFLGYVVEIFPAFLIACFCLTMTVVLNSPVLGIMSTFFLFILSTIAENIKQLKLWLPSYQLLIWRDVVRAEPDWPGMTVKLLVVLGYCLLLYTLAIINYRRKEVFQ